jgi:hypothetical protein
MKATIKQVYAVYSTDDRGYSQGDPLVLYPFYAAAKASEENKKCAYYSHVCAVEASSIRRG